MEVKLYRMYISVKIIKVSTTFRFQLLVNLCKSACAYSSIFL